MNVFALLRRKREPVVYVPRETLWTRTTRYHKEQAQEPVAQSKGLRRRPCDRLLRRL